MSPSPMKTSQDRSYDNRKIIKSAMNSYSFNDKSQQQGFMDHNSLKSHLLQLKKPNGRQKSQMAKMSDNANSIERENFDNKVDEDSLNQDYFRSTNVFAKP